MEKDNVRLIQGNATPSMSKESIRKMRAELPILVEYFAVYSEMVKAKFEALKKQGFTEAQAIELCKTLF